MVCFDQAAVHFGWNKRATEPGTLIDGEWQVGYGCATACYPSNVGPAAVRIALTPDGKATAALAGHEIGTGAYTTVALAVAQFLGVDIGNVSVQMGDSDLPPIMIAGGSNNAASATNVVAKACEEIRGRIAMAAVGASDSVFHNADPATLKLKDGRLRDAEGRSELLRVAVSRVGHRVEVYAENIPVGLPQSAVADMSKGKTAMLAGSGRKDATAFAFGAHFVEVRVHKRTRELRVARVVMSRQSHAARAGPTATRPAICGR
jgi:xanthine dehydrogenase YagR molybdenum-binding subunit